MQSLKSPHSDLSASLETILEGYGSARASAYTHSHPISSNFANAKSALSSRLAQAHPSIRVVCSFGKGIWAKVPWIALLDSRVTNSPQNGVYIVFLFSEDTRSVYLTLNQGVTELSQRGRSEFRKLVLEKADEVRQFCGELPKQGFLLDNAISLTTTGGLGASYEFSTIAHKRYEKGAVPRDEQLFADIGALLTAYDRYAEATPKPPRASRSWIFQANPKLYDLEGALAALTEQTWLVKQYESEICKGDLVYVWQAGKTSGVVAVGTVVTDPTVIEARQQELPFMRDPEAFAGPKPRVLVKIDSVLPKVVSRTHVAAHPVLGAHQIVRAAHGTNFKLDASQAVALAELIDRGLKGDLTEEPTDYHESNERTSNGLAAGAIERWREYWNAARLDSAWMEAQRPIDEKRREVLPQIADLLTSFIRGETSLTEFRNIFDRKTRSEWDPFGLKGFGGAMFLNKLDKHLDAKEEITQTLRQALTVPEDDDQARGKIVELMAYLERQVAAGVAENVEIQPSRVPFFVSACWHIQTPDAWPAFYKTVRKVFQEHGLLGAIEKDGDGYIEFARVFRSLAKELSIPFWDLEHLCERVDKSLKGDASKVIGEGLNSNGQRAATITDTSPDHRHPSSDDNADPPAHAIRLLNPLYTLENMVEETGIAEAQLIRWTEALSRKKQMVLQGPPGTGKTFLAKCFSKKLLSETDGIAETVQFHPAYAYEDFIQGIRPVLTNGIPSYSVAQGHFVSFCQRAALTNAPCVFLIDEFNRANLARVLGELLYLLEYRDASIQLASGGVAFRIPDNVIIIGTMNTADRSIARMDYALRRRFSFVRLRADYELLKNRLSSQGLPVDSLVEILSSINQMIGDPNYELGVSYFLTDLSRGKLQDIWEYEIEPYLEEYFFDQPNKVAPYRWNALATGALREWA